MKRPLTVLSRSSPAVAALALVLLLLAPHDAFADCAFFDDDLGVPCDDITGIGCCLDSSTVIYCGGTTLCASACDLLDDCGWDGSIGGFRCMWFPGTPPAHVSVSCPSCGELTYEGCCEGSTLRYCAGGLPLSLPCGSNPAPNNQCGWVGAEGYDCTSHSSVGSLPRDCPGAVCVGQCDGRVCGSDGCGGSCGRCTSPLQCDETSGTCVVGCEPQCAGKECGPDGCGGSCGTCTGGLVCDSNRFVCVADCVPNCFGRDCGDNGCGGQCGVCPAGTTCRNYRCVADCVPDCLGRECGSDGCGGDCGGCPLGQWCDGGSCAGTCVPECTRRECGPDGCGGTCGVCGQGYFCNEFQICEVDQTCVPDCEGRECGFDPVCSRSCGVCGGVFLCHEGRCVTCVPDCEDRECGSDGCDGICGTCTLGATCTEQGRCLAPELPVDEPGDDPELPAPPPGDGPDPPPGGEGGAGVCPPGYRSHYGSCLPDGEFVDPNDWRNANPSMSSSGGCGLSGRSRGGLWSFLLLPLGLLTPRFFRRGGGRRVVH